jgi:predicted ATPase
MHKHAQRMQLIQPNVAAGEYVTVNSKHKSYCALALKAVEHKLYDSYATPRTTLSLHSSYTVQGKHAKAASRHRHLCVEVIDVIDVICL